MRVGIFFPLEDLLRVTYLLVVPDRFNFQQRQNSKFKIIWTFFVVLYLPRARKITFFLGNPPLASLYPVEHDDETRESRRNFCPNASSIRVQVLEPSTATQDRSDMLPRGSPVPKQMNCRWLYSRRAPTDRALRSRKCVSCIRSSRTRTQGRKTFKCDLFVWPVNRSHVSGIK